MDRETEDELVEYLNVALEGTSNALAIFDYPEDFDHDFYAVRTSLTKAWQELEKAWREALGRDLPHSD